MDLKKIKKPTLLLDESKCRSNIMRMTGKARSSGVNFRPHFKTHQSASIGNWFSEAGVSSITVSSVTMAKYFAKSGWTDITIAFPLNVRELDEAEKLSESVNLNILISDFQQALQIGHGTKLKAGCFIKIDTGNKRSGIEWNDHDQLKRMMDVINKSKALRFAGFLTHSGHTYKAESPEQIIDIYNDTLSKMSGLRTIYHEKMMLSTGDTPSCSLIRDFSGFDEIRPGNFVFFDLMQYFLGSCNFDEIAMIVACPIVEKNLRRKEIIIYGGGVHLSKDHIKANNGETVYGKAVLLNCEGWTAVSKNDFVRTISQEHGIIVPSDELFRSVNIGDLIGIIPVHSCMTADLLREYHTIEGKIISDFSPK